MDSRPTAHIELSITLSPNIVHLSRLDETLTITVAAKLLSSTNPSSGIIFNARRTSLDSRAGLFYGAILLCNNSDPNTVIPLGPAVSVSYSGNPRDPDLRHNDFERFVVVPRVGGGELKINHEMNVERVFRYSREVQPADVVPGAEYRLELQPSKLGAFWWTFEAEAEGKKFFEGIFPDEYGLNGLKDEDPKAIEKLYSEGWLYSYPISDFRFSVAKDSEAILKFVE